MIANKATSKNGAAKALPEPNADFYQLYGLLNADELALVKKVGKHQ